MSSSEALRIDAHDESCAHFKRRVGSLDALMTEALASPTRTPGRVHRSHVLMYELLLDYLEGVERHRRHRSGP